MAVRVGGTTNPDGNRIVRCRAIRVVQQPGPGMQLLYIVRRWSRPSVRSAPSPKHARVKLHEQSLSACLHRDEGEPVVVLTVWQRSQLSSPRVVVLATVSVADEGDRKVAHDTDPGQALAGRGRQA